MSSVRAAGLVDELVAAMGGDASRVAAGDSERDLHAADMTFHEPRRPAVVVYPLKTAEVAAVLAIADERRVAVTPFGVRAKAAGAASNGSGCRCRPTG